MTDKNTNHRPGRGRAAANDRARGCHGEVFLADGEGGHSDYACYRELPRKMKI